MKLVEIKKETVHLQAVLAITNHQTMIELKKSVDRTFFRSFAKGIRNKSGSLEIR